MIKFFNFFMVLDIRFDIKNMPKDMPSKWIERKINTVQFVFGFLGVKFIDFNIDKDSKNKSILKGEKIAIDKNKITIKNSEGKVQLSFFSKWSYIKSMSGYQQN